MCLCRINKQVDLGYCVYAEYFGSSWQCSLKLLKPVYSLLLDFTVSLGFYGLSSGHVWMWELDYNESWAPKNWCFWTVVLDKTLESPLNCKEIQPVHPKGNQSWIFIGRTDVKAEIPTLWPSDSFEKTLILGNIEGGTRRGQQRVRRLAGITNSVDTSLSKLRELVMDRETCRVCSPWGRRVDTTEQLNWIEWWISLDELTFLQIRI